MTLNLQESEVEKQVKRIQPSPALNKLVLLVGIIEPLMTLPQAYIIWVDKKTSGVSSLTWLAYMVAGIIWMSYGIKLKDKPIIITSILWLLMEAVVISGLLIR